MKDIPILIINRDRLSTTRKLCEDLRQLGYTAIYIIDMRSTYSSLLDWYKTQDIAEVIYMKENLGQQVFWKSHLRDRFKHHQWIAYTDSDIELNPDTPTDFIERMIVVAKDFRADKVGLAIEYRDITNPIYKEIIEPIESRYWLQQLPYKDLVIYNAPIDTTFCIIKPEKPFSYQALRVAGDYTCRHIPWYQQFDNLSEEELYYMEHCDPQFATCRNHYQKWQEAHTTI